MPNEAGICARCGKPIDERRLEAVPTARYDAQCQAAIESANGVAFEFTFAGTNTGAWGPDTPATGKPFSFNGVTFMRVENGKIVY